MKKLLIFAFLLCAGKVFAQKDTVGLNIPFVDNAVAYERVYNVPGVPQNILYGNARVWFAGTHPDGGRTQITLRDSTLSRVAGKANYSIDASYKILWSNQPVTFTYNFTVQIDCKNNKYRIRIYNIQYRQSVDEQSNDGKGNIPLEAMMQSLINSKSLNLGAGVRISKNDLKQRLEVLDGIINNLLTDVNKKMVDNNDF